MILTDKAIEVVVERLSREDDPVRTEAVDELLRRAKRGEDISIALPTLETLRTNDDVLGIRTLAAETLQEAAKSRGNNTIAAKVLGLLGAKDWQGLADLVNDRHIGYEVRMVLEGKTSDKELSARLLAMVSISKVDVESLPAVVRGIVLIAEQRHLGRPEQPYRIRRVTIRSG